MNDIEQAIAWYQDRAEHTPMTGTREMFRIALEALREKAERESRSSSPDIVVVTRCRECVLRGTVACVLDGLYYKLNKDSDYCSYGKKE